MDAITLIENYLVYLITECGLSVTLHPLEQESLITFSRLMRYNIHDNSYCTAVKSDPARRARCHAGQWRVLEKCRRENSPFCGVCHAGVAEFVYPITDGERTVGFVSVSGYATPEGRKHMEGFKSDALALSYGSLKGELPARERIDTLVLPLLQMLELAYRKQQTSPRAESTVTQILRYLQQNYAQDLTEETLCRVFYCSRSHLSHTFKRETGKSLREYLTQIRVDHAKRLLRYSTLSVTEIALSVGFNDSNYFSNVFKRSVGLSPLAYRREIKK